MARIIALYVIRSVEQTASCTPALRYDSGFTLLMSVCSALFLLLLLLVIIVVVVVIFQQFVLGANVPPKVTTDQF